MTYTVTYNAEASDMNYQAIQDTLNIAIAWEDESVHEDYENVYSGIAHDPQNEGVRISLTVRDIPDEAAPSDIYSAIQSVVNDINSNHETDLPSASEKATVRS